MEIVLTYQREKQSTLKTISVIAVEKKIRLLRLGLGHKRERMMVILVSSEYEVLIMF